MTDPNPTCLVAACEAEGVVQMQIDSLGGHNEGWFCAEHAPMFEKTWTRIEPEPEQMDLFGQ